MNPRIRIKLKKWQAYLAKRKSLFDKAQQSLSLGWLVKLIESFAL
jgi:hypothetical protein